jgi:plasmid stability protein
MWHTITSAAAASYPGATDLEVDWTLEAAADPRSIVHDPDPKSRSGAVRIIGYSPSAGFVVMIIATGSTHAGVTAWKSSGADLATTKGRDDHDRHPEPASLRDDAAIAADVRRVREEYADEEAEAAEIEAAENAAALEVSLSLRITRELDDALKRRSAAEQISPSAMARRLLRQALQSEDRPVLTTQQVEEIARRIMRESA